MITDKASCCNYDWYLYYNHAREIPSIVEPVIKLIKRSPILSNHLSRPKYKFYMHLDLFKGHLFIYRPLFLSIGDPFVYTGFTVNAVNGTLLLKNQFFVGKYLPILCLLALAL